MSKAEELINNVRVGDVIRYIPTIGEVRKYEVLKLWCRFEAGFTCYNRNEGCISHVYNRKIREKINSLQLVGGSSG